jgi:hypothetical protein
MYICMYVCVHGGEPESFRLSVSICMYVCMLKSPKDVNNHWAYVFMFMCVCMSLTRSPRALDYQ